MNGKITPIRRLLVPHDFSDTAQHAMDLGLELARKLGASVTVMHVYELPSYGFPDGPAMTADMAGRIEHVARRALEGVAGRARDAGVDVQSVLRQGLAWTEIVAVAEETKADMIVMGTHGRRGFTRMLLGSVAERVVRAAPCPVLTVRGPTETK